MYVRPGSPLKSTWRAQAGKKIGILDGWWTDEFCLNRNADKFTSVGYRRNKVEKKGEKSGTKFKTGGK